MLDLGLDSFEMVNSNRGYFSFRSKGQLAADWRSAVHKLFRIEIVLIWLLNLEEDMWLCSGM